MPRSPSAQRLLTVGIGDIHGRFLRVQAWLETLEAALGRQVDAVFAVGDVEAFASADDHRRKAAKKLLPAEFSEYVSGTRKLTRPFHFIGGNNEDFEPLHPLQAGGPLIPGADYLGRAGVTRVGGLEVGFLSGIYAPKHFGTPLEAPTTRELQKRAGYFCEDELKVFEGVRSLGLMLVHEWPRGLVRRGKAARPLRAHRFPWIGNPVTRAVVKSVRPRWLWCGHSHVAYAASIDFGEGEITRVACLDQAASPEGALFWLEWEGQEPVRAGWGLTGEVSWQRGEVWDEGKTPAEPAT